MAEIKGIQLKATLVFLKQRFGEAAVEAAIEALSPEDRALLPAVLLDSNWYPFDAWRPVSRVSRAVAGEPSPDLAIETGKFIAQYVFTGAYKSLLVNNPIKQVEKFSWINEFFYRNVRRIETQILGDSSCLLRYRYEQSIKPARGTCIGIIGFWVRTLELSGASNVKSTHSKCLVDGKDCCEYLFEWS
jgi:hypothetical protein